VGDNIMTSSLLQSVTSLELVAFQFPHYEEITLIA